MISASLSNPRPEASPWDILPAAILLRLYE